MLLATLALPLLASHALADGPFSSYDGAWRGYGQVRMDGGQTEKMKCKGYYNSKSGGAGLSIAIECGNPSFKIHMRANLEYSNGQVSGTWEERQFNQAGSVTGKATAEKLNLAIGGGITGTMNISTGGGSQSVSISTQGPGFRGANLQFSRG
jgi:hypothetical protein